jgi:hypothetical protein
MSLTTPAARRDLTYHLHPSTNLRSVQTEGPLVITRGEGVYVFDEEGHRYLDGLAGLWCASLGFSERRLAEAAYRQMKELPFYHSFAGKVPAVSTLLAEALIRIAPAGMRRALFANSGSEANDTAVKLAWYVNNALGRPEEKIISRQRLPRHDDRRREPHRSRFRADRFRFAHRPLPAHRLSALLSGRTRGKRGGVRHAARLEPRAADPARRPRHDRAFFAERSWAPEA